MPVIIAPVGMFEIILLLVTLATYPIEVAVAFVAVIEPVEATTVAESCVGTVEQIEAVAGNTDTVPGELFTKTVSFTTVPVQPW